MKLKRKKYFSIKYSKWTLFPKVDWKAKPKLHLATLNIYSPSDIHEICQMSINAIQVVKQNYFPKILTFHFKRVDFSCYVIKKTFNSTNVNSPKFQIQIDLYTTRPQSLQPNMLQAVNHLNSTGRIVYNWQRCQYRLYSLVTLAASIWIEFWKE